MHLEAMRGLWGDGPHGRVERQLVLDVEAVVAEASAGHKLHIQNQPHRIWRRALGRRRKIKPHLG